MNPSSESHPTSQPDVFPAWASSLKFGADGLLTAVAVDDTDGTLLMLAHMNLEAVLKTFETGIMTYWSRSRKKLWVKGETSDNLQKVISAYLDCDGDAMVFRVKAEGLGAACHEGYRSCFFRRFDNGRWEKQGAPVPGWSPD
jgi:phosphoribosyl-AMP cyclohydrolase